jgi:hypothetical protein
MGYPIHILCTHCKEEMTFLLPIPTTTINPATGLAEIQTVGGIGEPISSNPVLTNAGAYHANDYVGTSGVAMPFPVARVAGGTGLIYGAALLDKALQSVSLELWLFKNAPTPPADNAAWDLSDAAVAAAGFLGVIPFYTYYATASNSVSQNWEPRINFRASAGSQNIYGCAVTRGTPTYASLGLIFTLFTCQD